jgi:hypothetical protein
MMRGFSHDGSVARLVAAFAMLASAGCMPPPQQTGAAQPAPPQQIAVPPGYVAIPAGTRLMVRTVDAISSGSHKPGARFQARLETAISVGGQVVVPAGASVYGKVIEARAGKVGRPLLVVELSDLQINQQLYPIKTNRLGAEGGRAGAGRKVAAGAMIGGAFGGGSGAGKGAAIGGGAALLGPKKAIRVPANTLGEFQLEQPVAVPQNAGAAVAAAPTAPQPPAAAPPPPAPAPAPAPAAAAASPAAGAVTLPAGTRLMVRTIDALSSGSHRTGAKFAVRLENPIAVGNQIAVPAGTTIYGQVKQARKARRVAGRALLVVGLVEINLNGKLIPIATNAAGAQGDRSGTVAKVGAGTIIGAAFGGGSGAGKGAAIGGAVALLTPGKQIRVPPKTLVEFSLTQPAVIP